MEVCTGVSEWRVRLNIMQLVFPCTTGPSEKKDPKSDQLCRGIMAIPLMIEVLPNIG